MYRKNEIVGFKQLIYTFFHSPDCGKNYLHYGGACCFSCRAFFRRAHQTSIKPPYFVCCNEYNMIKGDAEGVSNIQESATSSNIRIQKDLQCGVDVDTRRQCQYCRYKRCIAKGNDNCIIFCSLKLQYIYIYIYKAQKFQSLHESKQCHMSLPSGGVMEEKKD
jgi:hypothetical protein